MPLIYIYKIFFFFSFFLSLIRLVCVSGPKSADADHPPTSRTKGKRIIDESQNARFLSVPLHSTIGKHKVVR